MPGARDHKRGGATACDNAMKLVLAKQRPGHLRGGNVVCTQEQDAEPVRVQAQRAASGGPGREEARCRQGGLRWSTRAGGQKIELNWPDQTDTGQLRRERGM